MSWKRRVKQPEKELTEDIGAAGEARRVTIIQRTTMARAIEFLSERKLVNNFGDELELSFIPKSKTRKAGA